MQFPAKIINLIQNCAGEPSPSLPRAPLRGALARDAKIFVGSRACAANHYVIAEKCPYVMSNSAIVDFTE